MVVERLSSEAGRGCAFCDDEFGRDHCRSLFSFLFDNGNLNDWQIDGIAIVPWDSVIIIVVVTIVMIRAVDTIVKLSEHRDGEVKMGHRIVARFRCEHMDVTEPQAMRDEEGRNQQQTDDMTHCSFSWDVAGI